MAESGNAPKLSELYQDLWETYLYTENTNESCSSDDYQMKLRHGIKSGEQAIQMVNQLHLFSENEGIEEVATNEVRYILLPAILGYLNSLLLARDMKERLPVVNKSKDYFTDFLRMCKSYEVTEFELPSSCSTLVVANTGKGPPDLRAMSQTRELKIRKFKEQKERGEKLKDLSKQVEKEHVDDEVKREYYLTLCKQWIDKALEEVENIESELTIIKFREQSLENGDEETAHKKKGPPKKEVFRPFIITKDIIQKQVIGPGYPSLPTLTIDEFYEQKVKDGTFKIPTGCSLQDRAADPERDAQELEKEETEKENQIEKDDEETLQKAREWDDWKDDHRRGWGNRHNMG